jgi:hypothetical protein
MTLLLQQRGSGAKITEEILKAAAENTGDGREEVMALLLKQRGSEGKTTEDVLKAAAENRENEGELLALLHQRKREA